MKENKLYATAVNGKEFEEHAGEFGVLMRDSLPTWEGCHWVFGKVTILGGNRYIEDAESYSVLYTETYLEADTNSVCFMILGEWKEAFGDNLFVGDEWIFDSAIGIDDRKGEIIYMGIDYSSSYWISTLDKTIADYTLD